MDIVHVDCGTCSVRGDACSDCVITVLLGAPREVDLTAPEQQALDALAGAGLVPPLRLVTPVAGPREPDEGAGWAEPG